LPYILISLGYRHNVAFIFVLWKIRFSLCEIHYIVDYTFMCNI
jgi:hypothetical protein